MRDFAFMLCIVVFALGCGGDNPSAAFDGSTNADAAEVASEDRFIAPDRSEFDVPSVNDIGDGGGVADVSAEDLGVDVTADALPACGALRERCGTDCVDITSDPTRCGSCSTDCRALPGVRADGVNCIAGTCVITGTCSVGRGDCDHDARNGCETDLSRPSTCGRCDVSCSDPRPLCTMLPPGGALAYMCSSGCTEMTPDRCGSTCVDLYDDPRNCGACGRECPLPEHGRAGCTATSCRLECLAGFHLCGTSCLPNDSVDSCGDACSPCAAPPPNATATCTAGVCGVACNTGFHRCGGACVSNTSPGSCGSSCSPCLDVPNGTATCDGTNCGASCNVGFHRCGIGCLPNTSTDSCGASCSSCPVPFNAVATCTGTPLTCGFRCGTNSADCDGDPSNGCETRLTSSTNCGACGTVCPAVGAHAVSYCQYRGPEIAPSCIQDCASGYVDCDGNVANGCEAMGECFREEVLFSENFETSSLSQWTIQRPWYWHDIGEGGVYPFRGRATLGSIPPAGTCRQEGYATTQDIDIRRVTRYLNLSFAWLANRGTMDGYALEVSTDRGATWNRVDFALLSSGATWNIASIDLAAFIGQPSLRVRFYYLNICGGARSLGWYIDELVVRAFVRTY